MTDFAAIDFETANGQRSSVCSVGVVVVRGGIMLELEHRQVQFEGSLAALNWQHICKQVLHQLPSALKQ